MSGISGNAVGGSRAALLPWLAKPPRAAQERSSLASSSGSCPLDTHCQLRTAPSAAGGAAGWGALGGCALRELCRGCAPMPSLQPGQRASGACVLEKRWHSTGLPCSAERGCCASGVLQRGLDQEVPLGSCMHRESWPGAPTLRWREFAVTLVPLMHPLPILH